VRHYGTVVGTDCAPATGRRWRRRRHRETDEAGQRRRRRARRRPLVPGPVRGACAVVPRGV